MAKSRRKKNYKLRKRVMRTVAALTMIMAIVVAAIPVENYGTMRAADGRNLDGATAESELNKSGESHYDSSKYEQGYGNVPKTVQRIRVADDGTLSLVDMFEVKTKGSNAIITKDIIGDGSHIGETELSVNQTEYCNYVQFDPDFIRDVKTALDSANSFEVTFQQDQSTTLDVSSVATVSSITVKTIKKDDPADSVVTVSITIDPDNKNAQGYTEFSTIRLSSSSMYAQDFGKARYDAKMTQIDAYNADVNAFITKVNAFITKVSASGYTWESKDENEWNGYVSEAQNLNSNYNTTALLSNSWDDFNKNEDNGLEGIIDYIIRNYCKKGNTDLVDYQLKSLLRQNDEGDVITVYVPQYTKPGTYNWLDENNYLPATADSKVTIVGIASRVDGGDSAFYKTTLNKITLPQGIQFIGENAFGDSNLTEVTINTTACEIIGESAFAQCTSLSTVKFEFSGDVASNRFITIDKKAFYNTAITSVTIPSPVTTIGVGAFAGIRALTTVEFDDSSRGSGRDIAIEKYAFYNCDGLNDVKFPTNNSSQYVIGEGAFAVEGNLSGSLIDFTFPGGNTKIDYSGDTKYKDNYIGDCDYILANRETLQTVTFPGKLGSEIPDNTLSGCNNLSWVKFPEGAKNASYSPDKLFADVWGDLNFYVEGPETKGSPNTRSVPRETTWKAKAGYYDEEYIDEDGDKKTRPKWVLTSVPYKFIDADGNVHFEIGVKEKEEDTNPTYIATIDVIDEGKKEAQLSEYFKYDQKDLTENIEITIPAMVGEYRVVSIADNCFNTDENLRNHIYRLNILDDSVREIKAEAFKGMKELQWVFIGDAVEKIGSGAFEDCNKLENVEFSQTLTEFYSDTDWENALTIGNNAFKTGSEFLTFHGAINPEYAPFKLAMSEESSSMTSQKSKANICYKTDAPLHLTVIRDSDGKATLIDYPHYEEIDTWNKNLIAEMSTDEDGNDITDYSITEKFEIVNGIKDNDNNKNYQDTLGDMEEKVVEQVLNMELPAGIQNIDTKGYFTNDDNANDFGYFNKIYVEVTKGDKVVGYKSDKSDTLKRELNPFNTSAEADVRKLYSTYEGLVTDEIKTVPGLFSGFFDESEIETGTQTYGFTPGDTKFIWGSYRGHTYTENNNRGNDYLTSINMPTVEKLQNYAFDSNENVKELTIGRALNEIGIQPFRDCKSLWQIHTGDSTKYEFENMILYDKMPVNGSGGYKIVQGLEGRGRDAVDGNYGSNKITADSNPLLAQVTDVADYAFANNEEIVQVDLSKTNIRDIANGTFNGCSELMEVDLPEKTKLVGDFALGGVNLKNFTLIVPNKDCQISQKVFQMDESDMNPSVKGVTIKGIMLDEDGDRSTTYDSYLKLQEKFGENNVVWSEMGKSYVLRFYDDNFGIISSEVVDVKDGETSATLSNPPSAPKKTGYTFDYWICPKVTDENGKPLTGSAAYSNVTEDRDIYAIYKEDPASVVPDGEDYTLTVENGKALVDGTIISTFPTTLKGGTTVTVIANDETNFKVWTITPGTYTALITSPSIFTTTFTMPNANVTVTANTAIGGSTDTPNPDGTYTVTVNNGTGGGNYRPGVTVTITANTAPTGQTFTNWTTTTASVSLANPNTASTTFVMPSSNVTVTANYSGGSGGNNQGGNTGDNNNDNNTTKHKVTVNYGSGSGEYAAGETVNITANAPESSNRVFSRWTTSNSGLGFANANSVSTSFVMPATDVVVTANYKTRTSDDDDDDDSTSRRPGTNTSTTTVNNRPSSSTSTTTSTTGTVNNPESGTSTTNNNNGNRIYITKNGISNTDVASLAVSGSTDNFIVRITESAEATAAVEQALTNTYGSLNGLAYLPMDISLYDSTGQNKITDTHGLNITVTMPIPDVLIQYGGNARVAAADNGVLQQITPRFTTIDGIACISFIPPHFSPYVIYVDTSNLIAGQMLDATPATGDPIHPKWFAAIGMACVSILLFVLSDGRKRKNYRAA